MEINNRKEYENHKLNSNWFLIAVVIGFEWTFLRHI